MYRRLGDAFMTPLAIMLAALAAAPATAQGANPPAANPVIPVSSYADVADLAVTANAIIDARIRRASPVPPETVPNLPPQLVRLYVEAEVNGVLFGRDPVARRVGFLVDQPRRADGRAPRLNGTRVLLFARPVTQSNRLLLVTPSAMLGWDAAREASVRSIIGELGRASPPPRVTGVGQLFHVPGTIPGESETQIFLRTESGDPVSLSILRRPGETPRWAVAFGEIVDESATVPQRRTLGWYRLACGLPPALPPASLAAMPGAEARATAEDYALVLRSLGACDRSTNPAALAVVPQR
jgi:hypothetical protein